MFVKIKAPTTLAEARDSIQDAIETDGQFSHNICSCTLRIVAAELGQEKANELIDEYALTERYGIHKVI